MILTEVHQDLFTVDDSFHLAHCIGAYLRMGAGIAVPMQKKFGIRGQIRRSFDPVPCPACILTGRVFNLITKKRSSGKPSYASLQTALDEMISLIVEGKIRKIAMPKIGCGLDRLQWSRVREMLQQTFEESNLEIRVCVWR